MVRNKKLQKKVEKFIHDFEALKISLKSPDSFKTKARIKSGQVFANREVHLKDIAAFGFDYDYTIAHYNESMSETRYEEAKKVLVEAFRYPKEIYNIKYDKNFACRGLHFDKKTGYIFKLSQYNRIQKETVYFARQKLTDAEVEKAYPGLRVTDDYIEKNLNILSDIFFMPAVSLLVDLIEFFKSKQADYDVQNLYEDTCLALERIHQTAVIHRHTSNNIGHFVPQSDKLEKLLRSLLDSGKKIFMLTNNLYGFVKTGCEEIFKNIVEDKKYGFKNWIEIFDVVVTHAKKPTWYETDRQFRVVDLETQNLTMETVKKFEKGKVYKGGCMKEFEKLLIVPSSKILYMGDEIFNDLQKPSKICSWKTVAIVPELKEEIAKMNSDSFLFISKHQHLAQRLLSRLRVYFSPKLKSPF